jgi:hypothetical protein
MRERLTCSRCESHAPTGSRNGTHPPRTARAALCCIGRPGTPLSSHFQPPAQQIEGCAKHQAPHQRTQAACALAHCGNAESVQGRVQSPLWHCGERARSTAAMRRACRVHCGNVKSVQGPLRQGGERTMFTAEMRRVCEVDRYLASAHTFSGVRKSTRMLGSAARRSSYTERCSAQSCAAVNAAAGMPASAR